VSDAILQRPGILAGVYPQREEDRVLDTVVHKIETVQRELGSVGAVLLDEMAATLDDGITNRTATRIERIGADAKTQTAEAELESQQWRDVLRSISDRITASCQDVDAQSTQKVLNELSLEREKSTPNL